MVRPRRSSLGNDAEVRLAHDLEVLFNEATDAHVGQVSKLRQGPTDRHVFVVAVVHGQPAVEIEEQRALGARQVVLPDQPDAVPIQVTWNDDVLPRVEATRPASRREGLRGQENRMRDLVAPRREGVREVHDEALVREDEDVIHTMSPLEEGKLAEQLPKNRVRIGASSVLVLVVPNEHRVIIISFDAREAPLLKGRRHVVVAGTVVRDEEKIGLVRVQRAARGCGEVAMQRHLDPPLPGRAEQRAQREIPGVINEHLQLAPLTIVAPHTQKERKLKVKWLQRQGPIGLHRLVVLHEHVQRGSEDVLGDKQTFLELDRRQGVQQDADDSEVAICCPSTPQW
mmetsp:Transcript_88173/g.284766  ORF Transcript_88173/g.284766 Transcript_88173/m.284766 type:complete len:341 (+) Transcript_88173:433-1455(+)